MKSRDCIVTLSQFVGILSKNLARIGYPVGKELPECGIKNEQFTLDDVNLSHNDMFNQKLKTRKADDVNVGVCYAQFSRKSWIY